MEVEGVGEEGRDERKDEKRQREESRRLLIQLYLNSFLEVSIT